MWLPRLGHKKALLVHSLYLLRILIWEPSKHVVRKPSSHIRRTWAGVPTETPAEVPADIQPPLPGQVSHTTILIPAVK